MVVFIVAAYLTTIYHGGFIIWILIGTLAIYLAMYIYPKLHERLYNWIYQ